MSFRARPTSTHGRTWDDRDRRSMLLNIGFGVTVAVAVILLLVAFGYSWYNEHLAAAASVDGQSISRDAFRKQFAINSFRNEVQGRRVRTLLTAGKLVGDRNRAFLAVAGGHHLFTGLAGPNDAAFRVEPVGGLGDAVEVEIGGERLDARAPGSHHRGNDGLDLIAHPLLERDLALIGAHAARRLIAIAVGQQAAGFVDDRNALRLQPVDGGRGEMADRPHLRRIEAAAHLEHD